MGTATANARRKWTFLWQAILILLPVVVLAAFGLFSLRQDKVLAQHDAADRAQFVADDLAQKIWTGITTTNQFERQSFLVNDSGEVIYPPPFDEVPLPKPVLSPDDAAAVARFDAALRLIQEEKFSEAASALDELIARFPSAVGESGLPLQPLAAWKLLELPSDTRDRIVAKDAVSPNAFYSNAVFHPTPLTPYFLREAPEDWQELWQEHERSRKLFLGARKLLRQNVDGHILSTSSQSQMSPRLFWFEAPMDALGGSAAAVSKRDGSSLWLVAQGSTNVFDFVEHNWLAVRFQAGSNHYFVCYAESVLGSQLARLMADRKLVPEYFGLDLEIGGKEVREFGPDLRQWHHSHDGGKGGGDRKEVEDKLATAVLASAGKWEAGAEQLKVKVYLTSPSVLFQRQRLRTFWFGALIAVSAATALIGLMTAWRAFARQQELGELKSNFVSSVSHELRAPIASVRLLAESLERGRVHEPAKQHEYFRFIGQECRRLSALIENVLDFSRIEQGRKQYEFEPTDLGTLVDETVKLMQPYAAERGTSNR